MGGPDGGPERPHLSHLDAQYDAANARLERALKQIEEMEEEEAAAAAAAAVGGQLITTSSSSSNNNSGGTSSSSGNLRNNNNPTGVDTQPTAIEAEAALRVTSEPLSRKSASAGAAPGGPPGAPPSGAYSGVSSRVDYMERVAQLPPEPQVEWCEPLKAWVVTPADDEEQHPGGPGDPGDRLVVPQSGKPVLKMFTIRKFGFRVARERAVEWRDKRREKALHEQQGGRRCRSITTQSQVSNNHKHNNNPTRSRLLLGLLGDFVAAEAGAKNSSSSNSSSSSSMSCIGFRCWESCCASPV